MESQPQNPEFRNNPENFSPMFLFLPIILLGERICCCACCHLDLLCSLCTWCLFLIGSSVVCECGISWFDYSVLR